MVQAWQMPFRPPGAGVLGPRPGTTPHQAFFHGNGDPNTYPPPPTPTPDVWNNQALLAALMTANVPSTGPQTAEWYMDTGASSHLASNSGKFSSSHPVFSSSPILVGNGTTMPVTHHASSIIPTTSSPLKLNNILISPPLVKNLISVRKLTQDNNVSVEFDPFGFSIKDRPTQTVLLRCNSRGELYPLHPPSATALVTTAPTPHLWHQRLGHPGRHALHQTLRHVDFVPSKVPPVCDRCQLGKHVRLPFSHSTSASYFPFQIVHADVWTSPVLSFSGFKYYLAKSDVLPCLLAFHAYVQTQFQLPLLALQTDNGKEFDNQALRHHCEQHGIVLRLSCPYTSSQNGKAERILRTLNDCIRSLLIHASMPTEFWVEALSTATNLINLRPCQASGPKTPFELLFGVAPSYAHLRVFGCLCFPNQASTMELQTQCSHHAMCSSWVSL